MNIENRSIYLLDNIHVLKNIDSNSLDFIYIDPPFNKDKKWLSPLNRENQESEFIDVFKTENNNEWQEIRVKHPNIYSFLNSLSYKKNARSDIFNYLSYMTVRLSEMNRILKYDGSIILHCDHTASHYLKIIMDYIFGEKQFRNDIVWGYTFGGAATKQFSRKHDNLLYYTKGSKWTFNRIKDISLRKTTSEWVKKNNNGESKWVVDVDWWDIPSANNNESDYPTQKPIKLLNKIIQTFTNEGDMVLDAFCGGGTTLEAAEMLNRQWVGIDKEDDAVNKTVNRLQRLLSSNKMKSKGIHINDDWNNVINVLNRPPKLKQYNPPRKTNYLYVFYDGKQKYDKKIGFSDNVERRFKEFIGTRPDKKNLKILYKVAIPIGIEPRTMEKHIISKFPNIKENVKADLQDIISEIHSYGDIPQEGLGF